ncbi:hypothetical protein K438DRAFT_1766825 [Mycena galopus ATCC 62051]|nr:hypothetical protein K438DRAFT_1766825 [Mycena galopus ATCC 62051]
MAHSQGEGYPLPPKNKASTQSIGDSTRALPYIGAAPVQPQRSRDSVLSDQKLESGKPSSQNTFSREHVNEGGKLYYDNYGMYLQVEVQLTGTNALKGVRGTIVDVHDSAARRHRLETTKVADRNGLLFTIQEAHSSHRIENVPIEDILLQSTMRPLTEAHQLPADVLHGRTAPHEATLPRGSFPAPQDDRPKTPGPLASETEEMEPNTLKGEENGEWLSQPAFAGKRLDVQIIGVTRITTQISKAMRSLEGNFGWLLLEGTDYMNSKKIMVYGVGNNDTKHSVNRACIRPKRVGIKGKPFMDEKQRVVVVGSDVMGNAVGIGQYAQTVPTDKIPLSDDIVVVQFASGLKGLFPTARLCAAHNIALTRPETEFPATIFPQT